MTSDNRRKSVVRTRQARTGENYTTAARALDGGALEGTVVEAPLYRAVAPEGVVDASLPEGENFSLSDAYVADWGNTLANGYTPEGSVRDNTVRAGWALKALEAFTDAVGLDDESAISDLLCDMMHLCDALGVSFDGESARGRGHYEAEVRGEF